MANKDILRTLVFMEDKRAYAALDKATGLYFSKLAEIAEDIYDSCIKDYYAQYGPPEYPKVYGRHGNKVGYNLYRANNIEFDESTYNVDIDFDSDKLKKYYDGKRNRDKREKVLNSVMAGLRGTSQTRVSENSGEVWPKTWNARYPNVYSRYNIWKSKGTTMDEIFKDFMKNIMSQTKDLFYDYLEQSM